MSDMKDCKELSKCLCCEGENLRTILDLGAQSPANNYNVKEKFPLRLNVCLGCSHAQLSHSVSPDILFKNYPYMSGVSETMKQWYRDFAETIRSSYLGRTTVFEIACNDGSQLDEFKKLGLLTFGVDPAENIISIAKDKGHDVVCGYFDKNIVVDGRWFDIIVAQNVLAHTPDPFGMLMDAKAIMHKDSILCVQTSQSKMIENHQFDTIYHEHLSFFNKRSFSKLLSRCGLEIVEQIFLPDIHGGSDLFILKRLPEISILDYSDFQNRSYRFAADLKKKVEKIQKTNKVICYGAAAKMINLIRFTGIAPNLLLDDTETKKGKIIEGQECLSGSHLQHAPEGSYIIPVWNFYEELKAKVEKNYPGKFKFIKYIPEITIE